MRQGWIGVLIDCELAALDTLSQQVTRDHLLSATRSVLHLITDGG